MAKIREVEILQAAAVAVAAPRYMGAFASAMGLILLEHWPWFADVEIITGAAMALLEGWAIAFIFRNWRRLRVGSSHWRVLLVLQIALLVLLPATATPYLVSSQFNLPAHQILTPWLVWLWSFAVAAIAPLVVAAVGYADVGEPIKVSREPKEAQTNEPMVSREPVITQARDTDEPNGYTLVSRKNQVLTLLNQGLTQAMIADELKVSLATVKRDVKSLNGSVRSNG